ncbi:MAG: tRNA guanosine(34) transglycosylase Tgt [Prevotellaceae bacterium]|jgi:queuine tRNA-ribosyltransferase|nr:tRNA guanosine(34) transglycosylase Tgt [Prevotellaceae bacterium]
MTFKVTTKDLRSQARCGEIQTAHGNIKTPVFMPVGTVGSVKGVMHRDLLDDAHAQIILGNTYHLFLRPGMRILQRAGGLHGFASWDRPILTDSGGYQVFSLAAKRKLTPEGCEFRSHIDGSIHFFSPEKVVDIQRVIGADIMMALDECPPATADYAYIKSSLQMTQQWLERGVNQFKETEPAYGYPQSFFPIIQGGVFKKLRQEATDHAVALESDGLAIGGLSVGEPAEVMYEMIETVIPRMPECKPRYLMGVGTPVNILEGIARGVDMFDCVMPSRNGRNGMLFTSRGVINIRNQKWADDMTPIDPDGISFVDKMYTRAYLRHLFVSNEMLGPQIASLHNLAFYLWLVGQSREHIMAGDFVQWKTSMIPGLGTRL